MKKLLPCLFLVFLSCFLRSEAQGIVPVTIVPESTSRSPYAVSLDGSWRFLFIGPESASVCPEGWASPSYDDGGWDAIRVPGCWETQGFKQPEYGKDLSDCTGLYRTTFTVPSSWHGRRVLLRFDGVHMGYEVYVNGNSVGSYGSASNSCNFDITPMVSPGVNTLAVSVSTRSKGWEFDTMDNWTFLGINRDVTLFSVPEEHVEDITFVSDHCHDGQADVSVRVKAVGGHSVTVALYDNADREIAAYSAPVGDNGRVELGGRLDGVNLWTAETPTLYRLDATLYSAEGQRLYSVSQRVGIREVTASGRDILLNGRPILLHGVCVSEVSPFLGNAYSRDEWRKEMLMMKAAHVNFLRTAHYPMMPAFYELCDELGFYVCSEVPLASRGDRHLVDSAFTDEIAERTRATILRDKNHPSILIWALGNENKNIARGVATLARQTDSTRLRGFPQTVGALLKTMGKPHPDINVLMGHYLNEVRLDMVAEKATLPFVQTEYAHSLGLGFGDFEKKWQRILTQPGFAGGAVWCWMDGAAMKSSPMDSLPLKGVLVDGDHYLDSYGYDAPRGQELYKEANDGIVYADGTPQDDYWLVRKLYCPVQVTDDSLSRSHTLTVLNRYDFRSLSGLTLHWDVTDLRRSFAHGDQRLTAGPRSQETVAVDFDHAVVDGKWLSIHVTDRDGTSIYERTIPIESAQNTSYATVLTTADKQKGMSVSVNKKGELTIKDSRSGVTLMQSPLLLRVGREMSQVLQIRSMKNHFCWYPHILSPQVLDMRTRRVADGSETQLHCRWQRTDSMGQWVDGNVRVLIRRNGSATIDYSLTGSPEARGKLPECGLTLSLPEYFTSVSWQGRGLYASMPDKSRHAEPGLWAIHKDDFRFCGNRSETAIAAVAGYGDEVLLLTAANGNVAMENQDGRILLTQNLHVSGPGSKFSDPSGMLSPAKLNGIGGQLTIMPATVTTMPEGARQLFAPEGKMADPAPVRPFSQGYN